MKILVLNKQGKTDTAKRLIDKIISGKKLPQHLKNKSEELIGMM